MADQLAVEHAALVSAAVEVRSVSDELTSAKRSLIADGDELLSTWTGQAATDFRVAMSEWATGADEVMAALAVMSELIENAATGLDSISGLVSAARSQLSSQTSAAISAISALDKLSNGASDLAGHL